MAGRVRNRFTKCGTDWQTTSVPLAAPPGQSLVNNGPSARGELR